MEEAPSISKSEQLALNKTTSLKVPSALVEEYVKKLQAIREIYSRAAKILRPPQKMRKFIQKPVSRQNVLKLTPFVNKWREFRKNDKEFKKRTKNWRLDFRIMLNESNIYKKFFNSVWIYFKLGVRNEKFSFPDLQNSEWYNMFENLLAFLWNSIDKSKKALIEKRQKHQRYRLWIDDISVFAIEDLPVS